MQMNSPTRKKIFALMRQGDYAHPGEEAAIDLALGDFAPDRERRILDVGCGRGGQPSISRIGAGGREKTGSGPWGPDGYLRESRALGGIIRG